MARASRRREDACAGQPAVAGEVAAPGGAEWCEAARKPDDVRGRAPGALHTVPGGEPLQIIPEDLDPDEVMVVGHCIDRGFTGASGVAMIVDEGNTLTIPSWGVCHDGWNPSDRP